MSERDDQSLEDLLRASLADSRPPVEILNTVRFRIRRTPQAGRAPASARLVLLAAAVVIGGTAIAVAGSSRHRDVEPAPTTSPTSSARTPNPTPTAIPSLEAAWRRLPDAPIEGTSGNAIAWSGQEVFVWGGVPATGRAGRRADRPDGAAYDPASRSWRLLPKAPIGPRYGTVAAWTGSELLIWGGAWPWGDPVPVQDGAAYDPATNRWRLLPPAPLESGPTPSGAWTGEELVVAGAVREGHVPVAAYDPSGDSWRRLPDLSVDGDVVQLLWAGGRIVAVARPRDATPAGEIHVLGPDGGWHRSTGGLTLTATTDEAIPLGDEIAFLVDVPATTGTSATVAVLRYDPIRDERRLGTPSPAWMSSPGVWTGSMIIFPGANPRPVAYDPAADAWLPLPPNDLDPNIGTGAPVWAGDRVVRWSGSEGESFLAPRGGVELLLSP